MSYLTKKDQNYLKGIENKIRFFRALSHKFHSSSFEKNIFQLESKNDFVILVHMKKIIDSDSLLAIHLRTSWAEFRSHIETVDKIIFSNSFYNLVSVLANTSYETLYNLANSKKSAIDSYKKVA
ncbi:hypothetical protein [Halobacteriovorax sp. CON-3]|uniref:hypothetical protein n=1 Tax=Halobacteriovorax sp. CON-3 TaxID=3157710 RepID=UPI00371EC6E7